MKIQKLSHLLGRLAPALAITLLVAYAPYTTAEGNQANQAGGNSNKTMK